MKTNMNKVLILSLSAMLLASATGCERRGRAPLSGTASAKGGLTGPTGKTVSDDKTLPKPIASPVAPAPVTPPKYEVSTKEEELLKDAQMSGCKEMSAYNIDTGESTTLKTFAKDFETISAFKECMKVNGLVLEKPVTGSTTWTLQSDTRPEKQSPAYIAFHAEATKDGSTDDLALKVMGSRLNLSILIFSKMITKYDTHLKSNEIINVLGKDLTVNGTLPQFKLVLDALNAAQPDFKALRTVKNGIDYSLKSDVAADGVGAAESAAGENE